MNKIEAEQIIEDYSGALAAETTPARSISLLKNQKIIVKYAFFTYIEAIFSEGLQTNEIINNLIVSYSFIDCFLNDKEAKIINEISEKIKNKQIDLSSDEMREEKAVFGKFMSIFTSNQASQEIKDFIICMQNKYM